MKQSDERPFRIVHGFTPQNPEFLIAHTNQNCLPYGPPNHVALWVTNTKIWPHKPTPPLATAQSALQTWSITGIPVPDPSNHTTLILWIIIPVLLQVEWKLLTRGKWSGNDAQWMVVVPCLMCIQLAMWCREKMWKWGGSKNDWFVSWRRASGDQSRQLLGWRLMGNE